MVMVKFFVFGKKDEDEVNQMGASNDEQSLHIPEKSVDNLLYFKEWFYALGCSFHI